MTGPAFYAGFRRASGARGAGPGLARRASATEEPAMTIRTLSPLAFAAMTFISVAGCGGQIATGAGSEDESDSLDNTAADREAESAIVGQKAKVTASALNLRSGPST